MNNQGFDSKLLITIALTFGVFVGYQFYLKNKYPDMDKPKVATAPVDEKDLIKQLDGSVGKKPADAKAEVALENKNLKIEESELTIDDDLWTVNFSSIGMSVKNVTLKKYNDEAGQQIRIIPAPGQTNLETNIVGRHEPLNFTMKQLSKDQVVGVAAVNGMKISKTITLNSEANTLDTIIRVENIQDGFVGVSTKISKEVPTASSGGFMLMPDFGHRELYVETNEDHERKILTGDEKEQGAFSQVKVAGLSSQYFALALKDTSDVMPDLKWVYAPGAEEKSTTIAVLSHNMLNKKSEFVVKYLGYAGAKSYDHLHTVDSGLSGIIDFGFFNTFAVWLYKLLQFMHSAVGNWGYAIILLTALVRLVVMPFNIMSYKSMKVMSKVQPQIAAIKLKYKDDKMKVNEETMRIMKENKANPIGGCLPMLLQIPVFFALYRVLGSSVELYQAPFVLWITDLSAKDPYFVVPALMAITMFLQQKLTPNTMEPAQKKVMMIMLMGFSVLFFTLPAGLTLYMFISTLFGVVQQFYFMRDKSADTAAAGELVSN